MITTIQLFYFFFGLIAQCQGYHTYQKVTLSNYPDVQTVMFKPKFSTSFSSCQIQCSVEFNFNKGCTATIDNEYGNCSLLLVTRDSMDQGYSATTSIDVWARSELDQGEVVLVVGGFNGIGLYSTEMFSLNNKCNTSIGLLPMNLYQAALKIIQNSLWLCGGGTYFDYNKDCWSYNFQTNEWVWKTSSEFYHGPLPGEVYNNKLYFVDNANAEYYDPVTNVWQTWVPIPKPILYGCGSAIWRDNLVVTGGESFPNAFFIFSFTSNTWVEKQVPTVSLVYAALQILPDVDNMMLAVNYVNSALYDMANDNWEIMNNSVEPRNNAEMISVDGRTFILGGEANGDYLNSIEEFHLSNKSWTTKSIKLASMKTYPMAVKIPAFFIGCDGNF